jgi:dipeptidase E
MKLSCGGTSGFDTIIKDLLADGIVYGGWSAGAVVIGPSLKTIELMDPVEKAPEIIWEGLGLVPYFIWPHWNTKKYVHLQESAQAEMSKLPYEALTLSDGEALVVENDLRRIVT